MPAGVQYERHGGGPVHARTSSSSGRGGLADGRGVDPAAL